MSGMRARQSMTFSAFQQTALRALAALMMLLATSVRSNLVNDEDPFLPVTQDETVAVGGVVTLTCSVKENDNSSLQWSNTAQQTLYFGEKRALRDNRIQLVKSTATELIISIADVQLSDDGEYTCSIFTMPVRTARATVTVLGVPGKPVITGFDDAVVEGGKVTLTCTSSGSKPPAKLHWYRDQEEIQGRPDVVESNPDELTYTVTSELTLTVNRSDNNALIACAVDHASIANGDKRTEQPLSVLFSPSVSIHPESDLPREGEKFFLQCVGNGNPEPTAFVWRRKDAELPPLAKVDGAFLRFESLNKSDNGVYECQADNGIGMGDITHTLLVQDQEDSDLFILTSTLPSSSAFPTDSPEPSVSTTTEDKTLPPFSSSSSFTFSSTLPHFTSAPSTLPSSPEVPTTSLSNALFPDLTLLPSSVPTRIPPSPPSSSPATPSSVSRLNGVHTFTEAGGKPADPTAMSTSSGVDHAVIGGVVAVIVFIMLCLLIVLGRYLIRHKGTYLTHEAKGSDDAPDADTAIINAEGGHSGVDDKKEYFI
ncbi:cell adhesion molecule 3-like isoform X1 [Carassius auratus]|uniref:Cell adhesion molecule 3-like isoform X1 n=1 Tax=Carassius auratus TaxID=7957 RepID=A0A6P6JP09_CARAU|nr:cell adhesion molecule 3-like isoform X1 [Carassius auratus]XP_026061013.1 cell adhesion molecule 3-like isoform X1 [Carassius auratus]